MEQSENDGEVKPWLYKVRLIACWLQTPEGKVMFFIHLGCSRMPLSSRTFQSGPLRQH